jgi:hypothetical protein
MNNAQVANASGRFFFAVVMARRESPNHTGQIRKARQPAVLPARSRMTFRSTTGLRISNRRLGAE